MKIQIWKGDKVIDTAEHVFSVSVNRYRARIFTRIDPGEAVAAARTKAWDANEYDAVEVIDEAAPVLAE